MSRREYRVWAVLVLISILLVSGTVLVSAHLDARAFGAAQPWLDLAVCDLAVRLKIDAADIRPQNIESFNFADTSLGVPEPGQVYLTVITPGYVINLVADGTVYEYHAGGGQVRLAGYS